MKNKWKSEITDGLYSGPPISPVLSAAWGRTLALAMLMLAPVSSFAGGNRPVDNQNTDAIKPNSVVWGNPKPPSGVTTPVVTTLLLSGAASKQQKLSGDLQSQTSMQDDGTPNASYAGSGNEMVTVIVQHRQMPSDSHLRAMQSRGALIKSRFSGLRTVTMQVPVSMLAELAHDSNVAYITPDRPVKITANPAIEQFTSAVEADMAASQYGFDGSGLGVAVIDSGVSPNADLKNSTGTSRIVYSQSFVAGDTTTGDKFGHGTHVAGLVGGNGASSGSSNGYSGTYAGMAPNVNIINLRVLDQNGLGTDSQVIAAIQQAISLKNTYNIRVINMSLGRPVFESYTLDPVDQAVESAWKAGIIVVTAAGNNGRFSSTNGFGTIGVPANDPAVITVGATMTEQTNTRVDDKIASYSSKGPTAIDHIVKPDIVAPGNAQVSLRAAGSTLDTLFPQYELTSSNGTSNYFVLSGTSMATPVVSGAVALMLQQNSALTPDQVKARLMKTAWKGVGQYTSSHDSWGNLYNNEYDIFTYGAGYLDIDAALGNTDLASGIALSPTAVVNSNGSVTISNTSDSNFNGSSVVWGATSVVWGHSVVWGSNAISSQSVVWGATSVVWGATSTLGVIVDNSVVWGANSLVSVVSATSALSEGDPGDN